ncbi:SFXN4 protein, partial [Pitta sordida]|nr:SFXN4 protein [Pitta sordida]
MDANLSFWRAEGQSFFQRFRLWVNVLDPLLLLESSDKIKRRRSLIETNEKTLNEPIQNNQVFWSAVKILTFIAILKFVHPDTGKIIPVLFRPPAFMPVSLPLVIVSSLHYQAKQTFVFQFIFHTYTTGFTLLNGNGTTKAEDFSVLHKQIAYSVGAISYAACVGALPLIFTNRYKFKSALTELFIRKLLPASLLGVTGAFTTAVVRSPEFENGIEVMDGNGKVVGVSRNAGEKAVKETALSRGVLFGTTFFLTEVLVHFVQRAKFVKNPRALAAMRILVTTSVLTGMIPISFSMFPQCGEIKRADLEPEILSSTEETELFYNRGV